MKKTRFVLLVLLLSAIAVVIGGYRITEKRNRMLAPAKPAPIPGDLHSIANNWSWSQSSKDRPLVEARARDFRQSKDAAKFELLGVELKVFSKAGDTYDWIRSNEAQFDQAAEKLYSEGEVTIVLGLPAGGPPVPGKRYVEIRTSGLTYDNKNNVSSTERPVRFQFENGSGSSIGAVYDANQHYLWLKSRVDVVGAGAQAGMHIRAGELMYYEADQKIELKPWSSLQRGGQGVEAASSTVYLDKGNLKKIEAQNGKGWDLSPGRETRFSGAALEVNFTPEGTVAHATGIGDAQVLSQSASGVIKMNGGRVDLEFTTPPDAGDSELSLAYVRGNGRIESVPAAFQDQPQPESKVLSAEWIKVAMMPGGRDIQMLETLTPGRLDFIPNQPAQWKRILTADRMSAQYVAGNHPEKLHAVGHVQLRSDPPVRQAAGRAGGSQPQPRITWSDDLEALFDTHTGQMRELHQWSNFRYEEGTRKGRAGGARFDVANDRITLDSGARVWDETSVTAADLLVLDQRQDRMHAEGNVASTHQDNIQKGQPRASDSLFSSDHPIHATAQRLDTEQHNQVMHYSGSARLWQEGSSIQAQQISLNREDGTLDARGNVISVLMEDPAPDPSGPTAGQAGKSASPQRLVSISAESLLYTDQDRRAFYTGRALLRREHMLIRAGEIEAFLRPQEKVQQGESRIEHALARGQVEILETATDKHPPRKAVAQQAEYWSGEEKLTLRGGTPTLEQPGRGSTQGAELTYYRDGDRLLVNGRPGMRSKTHQTLKRN
jgi:lipopolysaccharide export system protein LptA